MLRSVTTTPHVETVWANGRSFEVTMCGEGERLALLLHGFPEHSISWRHQLPLMAELGFTAWAPNLRGYSGSDCPPHVQDYALRHLVDDVAGLIDAAGKRATLLIGHDWGGAIAWMTALTRARPLLGLIVMNCPHIRCYQRTMRGSPAHWWRTRYMLPFLTPWLGPRLFSRNRGARVADFILDSAVDRSRFPDHVIDVYREQAAQPGRLRAMMSYYRANLRLMLGFASPPEQEAIERVLDTPTLLLWGTRDFALHRSLTDGTDALVRDLTVHYIDDASHWIQQDSPEAVNEHMAAWITERLP